MRAPQVLDLFDVHAGTMAPIAVASLATLAGLFVVLDTGPGDRRFALAGLRPGVAFAARLAVVGLATAMANGVSLAVTATVFDPRQWGWYIGARAARRHVRAAGRADRAGVRPGRRGCSSPSSSRSWDIGMVQSPMLRGQPAQWAQ